MCCSVSGVRGAKFVFFFVMSVFLVGTSVGVRLGIGVEIGIFIFCVGVVGGGVCG